MVLILSRMRGVRSRRWLHIVILSCELFLAACSASNNSVTTPRPAPTRTLRPTVGLLATVAVPGGDQVGRGQDVYARSCAKCHGANLEGGFFSGVGGPILDAQQLASATTTFPYSGTAAGLYASISKDMPDDAPGSLSPVQYFDVTAYLLSRNGLLPPDTIVGPATARQISLFRQPSPIPR
jgi:mono/diheme cytochrome c family protein